MSRGGRGGGAVGSLPFEVDTALEDQIAAFREQNGEDDWSKTLYPPMAVHQAPDPTAEEKKLVNIYRKHRTAMRNGPFFIDSPKTGKRDAAEFNAFEDVATYGNKRAKRSGGLPNLKKVPIIKEFLPRQLWDVFADGEEQNGDSTKKDLTFLKKRRLDKLAQFDEGADVQVAEDEDANDEDVDDEDRVEIPEDDDFSEDESDLGNDYNAEKYFDDGDGVDDDGDEAGGDEAW